MTGSESIATQDVVNRFAESMVKGRADYVAEILEILGYSREYQRAHKYDFITVQFAPDQTPGAEVACVVHVPDEQVVFWFERQYHASIESKGEAPESSLYKYMVEYAVIADLDRITDDMWEGAKQCAKEAAESLKRPDVDYWIE